MDKDKKIIGSVNIQLILLTIVVLGVYIAFFDFDVEKAYNFTLKNLSELFNY